MVCFVKPQQRYIRSYWESFGEICREGRFLSSTEPFSYEDTEEFVLHNIQAKNPPTVCCGHQAGPLRRLV